MRKQFILFLVRMLVLSNVITMLPAYADSTFSTGFPGGGGGGGTSIPGNTLGTHNFANSINTSGVISGSQPAFTDVSGAATSAQIPPINLGSTANGGVTGILPITSGGSAVGLPQYYTHYRKGVAGVINRTAPCQILFYGDSTIYGFQTTNFPFNNIPNRLSQMFNSSGVNTREGYLCPTSQSPSIDTRWILNSSWTFGSSGGAGFSYSSGSGNLSIDPGYIFDTVKVIYITFSGYGTSAVDVDGTSLGSINANASAGLAQATFTCQRGRHTFNLAAPSGGNMQPMAFLFRDSTNPAIEISNCGVSGTTVSDYTTTGAPSYSMAHLNDIIKANLECVDLTINDANGATNPTTYQTKLQQIITTAFSNNSDVLLIAGNPTVGPASLATQQAYAGYNQALALTNSCNFLNMITRWIDATVSGPLLADGTHPNDLGATDLATGMFQQLSLSTGSLNGYVNQETTGTIAGSAGTLTWSVPNSSPIGVKRVVIKMTGYTNVSASVILFPVSFIAAPDATFNNSSLSPTISTSQISIPAAAAKTATIILEGI